MSDIKIKLTPEIKHRFTIEELKKFYKTAENAFAHGNYIIAIQLAIPNTELFAWCSIMLGNLDEGIRILKLFQENNLITDRSYLYLALGYWILNDKKQAITCVSKIADINQEAQKFLELLQKSEIGVILYSNAHEKSMNNFSKLKDVSEFNIKTIGFLADNDIKIDHNSDINLEIKTYQTNFNFDCSFLLGLSPYTIFHKSLHKVNIPKILFLSDHDYFIYNHCGISKNDILVTNGSIEHFEISGLYNLPCYTFYHGDWYSLLEGIPKYIENSSKNHTNQYDLVLTGSSLSYHMREKSQFILLLSYLNHDFKILVIDGLLELQDYVKLINQTKIMPTFVRFNDGFQGRATETYSYGKISMCSSECSYPKIYDTHQLNATYHYESLESDIEKALKTEYSTEDINLILENLAKIFPPSPQREINLLKYFSFMTCLNHNITSNFSKPYQLDDIDMASSGVYTQFVTTSKQDANYDIDFLKKSVEYYSNNQLNLTNFNAIRFMNSLFYLSSYQALSKPNIENAIHFGLNLIQQYSNCLVLCFNFGRFLYHNHYYELAFQIFKQIITNHSTLEINELTDDVLHFFSNTHFFPHLEYCNQVIYKYHQYSKKEYVEPKSIILSTVCHYLAHLLKTNQLDLAIQYANLGLKFYNKNYNLHRLICELYFSKAKLSNKIENYSLCLENFYESTKEYPKYLLDNIHYAIFSLVALNKFDDIGDLLSIWYSFRKRVRPHVNHLFINSAEQTLMIIDCKPYFKNEAKHTYDKIFYYLDSLGTIDLVFNNDELLFIPELLVVYIQGFVSNQKINFANALIEMFFSQYGDKLHNSIVNSILNILKNLEIIELERSVKIIEFYLHQ